MEILDALIVARAAERAVFMLCAPLLFYLGYRLLARALDYNGQTRAELRDKYKFQVATFLPGATCALLAVAIGFAIFSHPLELSKAEQDLLIKLDQIGPPAPKSAAPVPPSVRPEAVSPGSKLGSAPKPS